MLRTNDAVTERNIGSFKPEAVCELNDASKLTDTILDGAITTLQREKTRREIVKKLESKGVKVDPNWSATQLLEEMVAARIKLADAAP